MQESYLHTLAAPAVAFDTCQEQTQSSYFKHDGLYLF